MDEAEMPVLLSCKPLKSLFSHLNKIPLTSEQFTVGRNTGNSVTIPFQSISRHHCTFHKSENNEWFIKDTSSFGFHINNKKINKGHKNTISDGDIITFDPTAEFVYKFSNPKESYEIPIKRIKLDKSADNNILDDVKVKFEESQNFEIKHNKEKIQNAKHLQNTSMILIKQLQADIDRKMELLKSDLAQKIENLKTKKNEMEKQIAFLLEDRDFHLAHMKNVMEARVSVFMEQIQEHNEAESELLKGNNLLKENPAKEREEFFLGLSRESSLKQDLLERLAAKIQEQEEIRKREKQELQEALRNETEELRLAQEKELEEVEEQKRLRELEHVQELNNIKQILQQKVEETEQRKRKTEKQLNQKVAQLQKRSAVDKTKVKQLRREVERIQQEAQKSDEVIISLQAKLQKTSNDLAAVKREKKNLLNKCADGVGKGTSKQSALNEVGQIMEDELLCNVCAELFIEALTLNCSHTFCKYCITTWKKNKKDCPICRAPITAENRSIVLDSFIEKMVQNLSEEMKAKRQDILKYRAGIIINPSGGTTSNQIATVDLTRVPIPMSPAERPPVLAPPAQLERVLRPPRQESQDIL